jgi:hypothetical protein
MADAKDEEPKSRLRFHPWRELDKPKYRVGYDHYGRAHVYGPLCMESTVDEVWPHQDTIGVVDCFHQCRVQKGHGGHHECDCQYTWAPGTLPGRNQQGKLVPVEETLLVRPNKTECPAHRLDKCVGREMGREIQRSLHLCGRDMNHLGSHCCRNCNAIWPRLVPPGVQSLQDQSTCVAYVTDATCPNGGHHCRLLPSHIGRHICKHCSTAWDPLMLPTRPLPRVSLPLPWREKGDYGESAG